MLSKTQTYAVDVIRTNVLDQLERRWDFPEALFEFIHTIGGSEVYSQLNRIVDCVDMFRVVIFSTERAVNVIDTFAFFNANVWIVERYRLPEEVMRGFLARLRAIKGPVYVLGSFNTSEKIYIREEMFPEAIFIGTGDVFWSLRRRLFPFPFFL